MAAGFRSLPNYRLRIPIPDLRGGRGGTAHAERGGSLLGMSVRAVPGSDELGELIGYRALCMRERHVLCTR